MEDECCSVELSWLILSRLQSSLVGDDLYLYDLEEQTRWVEGGLEH